MLSLTTQAKEKLKFFLQERDPQEWGLQIRHKGGNNFHFSLVSLKEMGEKDQVREVDGFKIVTELEAEKELSGATIHFVETGWSSGFKIEPQPKAVSTSAPSFKLDLQDPLIQRIQKLVEEEINPALAGHGGYVKLLGFSDHTAYVEMGGGCQGCGMASATLRQGIELRLKEEFPEIHEVIDRTNHAAGENPFYAGN